MKQLTLAVVLSLALSIAIVQVFQIDYPVRDLAVDLHRDILTHEADPPYRYRVLLPLVAEAISRPTHLPVNAVHAGIGIIAAIAYVIGVHQFFQRILPPLVALIGTLMVGMLIHTTYLYNIVGIHYSWVEAALFVWSFLWLHTLYLQSQSH